jgi:hypothetical protein
VPSEAAGTLRLASPARDLAVFAERAARHDPATPVRLVADGDVLAAFVSTPFDCLGLRTYRLAGSASIDAVVEAVGLGARARSVHEGLLAVPPRLPDITWTQPLPPRSGWRELGTVPTAGIAARVVADTAEFRLRSTQVDAGRQAAPALEGIAQDLWARPLLADAPARLAHAADYLGFVEGEGEAVIRECGAWRRLDTRTGVTLVRVADPLGLFVR